MSRIHSSPSSMLRNRIYYRLKPFLPDRLRMQLRRWHARHVLERSADPHACLREVARVLIPEGQVLITGLNPLSFWGWQYDHDGIARARLDPDPARRVDLWPHVEALRAPTLVLRVLRNNGQQQGQLVMR